MSASISLYQTLGAIEDFRRGQGRVHNLQITLIIVIMANMSGYFGIRAIGDFINRNRAELVKVFNPKNGGFPSHQTFSRILCNINFDQFGKAFSKWAQNYVQIDENDWFSIDGKGIGGTVTNPHSQYQCFTNLVSVFSHKRKQVFALGKIDSKESEIPLVRKLIKELDLEGMVFTLDALHCQTATTEAIILSKNDYVIGVKGNQKNLYEQVKKTLETAFVPLAQVLVQKKTKAVSKPELFQSITELMGFRKTGSVFSQ